jgi:hypothetical protein
MGSQEGRGPRTSKTPAANFLRLKCSLLLQYLLDKHGGLVQSLLLLVEDANDNPPLFIQPPTSVTVKESGTYQLKTIMARVIRSNVFYSVEQTIV